MLACDDCQGITASMKEVCKERFVPKGQQVGKEPMPSLLGVWRGCPNASHGASERRSYRPPRTAREALNNARSAVTEGSKYPDRRLMIVLLDWLRAAREELRGSLGRLETPLLMRDDPLAHQIEVCQSK